MNVPWKPGLALESFVLDGAERDVARAILEFAGACAEISAELRRGPLTDMTSDKAMSRGPEGDAQKAIDLHADALVTAALRRAGVRALVSEEQLDPVVLNEFGRLGACVDPLDGSSNVGVDGPMASIFSLIDIGGDPTAASFLKLGSAQIAAAFAIYGAYTEFVFTIGDDVHCATLDPASDLFRMSRCSLRTPAGRSEFAINASNARHWPAPVVGYVADCLAGKDGPRGKDFNMRWIAAMAADAYRILMRGGVYLYPGDEREGYADGRLHVLYEANPIALIMERAGGAAIDGSGRILEVAPKSIHQRTPLIFGAADKVDQVAAYFREDGFTAARSPLFNRRGLLR